MNKHENELLVQPHTVVTSHQKKFKPKSVRVF